MNLDRRKEQCKAEAKVVKEKNTWANSGQKENGEKIILCACVKAERWEYTREPREWLANEREWLEPARVVGREKMVGGSVNWRSSYLPVPLEPQSSFAARLEILRFHLKSCCVDISYRFIYFYCVYTARRLLGLFSRHLFREFSTWSNCCQNKTRRSCAQNQNKQVDIRFKHPCCCCAFFSSASRFLCRFTKRHAPSLFILRVNKIRKKKTIENRAKEKNILRRAGSEASRMRFFNIDVKTVNELGYQVFSVDSNIFCMLNEIVKWIECLRECSSYSGVCSKFFVSSWYRCVRVYQLCAPGEICELISHTRIYINVYNSVRRCDYNVRRTCCLLNFGVKQHRPW